MTIEERLEKIEHELADIKKWNYRWDAISAGEFQVVDEEGKVRAILGMIKHRPELNLFDQQGNLRLRAALTVERGIPMLEVLDAKGQGMRDNKGRKMGFR